jgi:predicted helicase
MTCTEKALEIKNIIYWMSKLLNINVDTWIINCHTARTNRQKYLTEFKNNKLLSIMINVHILDEGIDIPECDSVFITKPNYNIINIVQRMCRANRIQENKEKCYIYLWCQKKKTDNIINYLSNNTNGFTNNKVIKLSIMNDKVIKDKIKVNKYKNIKTSTNFLDILNNKNDKNNSIYNFEIMKNYYKKFSTVPHDFISDFFIILKEYTDNEIIIDFELLCKWLNVRKDNLKNKLISKFEKNHDYTIEKIKKPQINSTGTTIYEKILITPYCMKELCMISQTAKAKEVRKYLIEMILTRNTSRDKNQNQDIKKY